jgi:hypothetical protein
MLVKFRGLFPHPLALVDGGEHKREKKKNTWLIGMPIMQCDNPQYIGPYNHQPTGVLNRETHFPELAE